MTPLSAYIFGGLALFTCWFLLKDKDIRYALGMLFLSGIGLYIYGPNSVLFGTFLSSGWIALNQVVFKVEIVKPLIIE